MVGCFRFGRKITFYVAGLALAGGGFGIAFATNLLTLNVCRFILGVARMATWSNSFVIGRYTDKHTHTHTHTHAHARTHASRQAGRQAGRQARTHTHTQRKRERERAVCDSLSLSLSLSLTVSVSVCLSV